MRIRTSLGLNGSRLKPQPPHVCHCNQNFSCFMDRPPFPCMPILFSKSSKFNIELRSARQWQQGLLHQARLRAIAYAPYWALRFNVTFAFSITLIHLAGRASRRRGRNGVAFSGVSLLSNPQCVQLRLEAAAIDYFGRCKFISHDVFHYSLSC